MRELSAISAGAGAGAHLDGDFHVVDGTGMRRGELPLTQELERAGILQYGPLDHPRWGAVPATDHPLFCSKGARSRR